MKKITKGTVTQSKTRFMYASATVRWLCSGYNLMVNDLSDGCHSHVWHAAYKIARPGGGGGTHMPDLYTYRPRGIQTPFLVGIQD